MAVGSSGSRSSTAYCHLPTAYFFHIGGCAAGVGLGWGVAVAALVAPVPGVGGDCCA
jgi:hypothetical protein